MAFDKGYALLVGIAEYGTTPGLSIRRRQTVNDAQGLQQVLTDPTFCGYPAEQVQLLTDKDATRDGFLGALDRLGAQATEDATVLVFYSGHGEFGLDGETYYLTTYETALAPDASSKNRVVDGSALRQDELLQRLKNIKAKRLLVIFNACHSGAFAPTDVLGGVEEPEAARGENLPSDTTQAILGSGEGRIVITACRGPQFSFIGTGERTLFADTLIQALQGQGWVRPNNNYIGVFDMYNYLFDTVKSGAATLAKKLTPQQLVRYANGVQEPEITVIGGVGPFPVALYKGRSPSTLGELAEEDGLDDEAAPVQISQKAAERMFRKYSVATTTTTTTTTTAGRDINTVGGNQTNIGGNQTTIGGNQTSVGGNQTITTGGSGSGDTAGGNIDNRTTIKREGGVEIGSLGSLGSMISGIIGRDNIGRDAIGKVEGDVYSGVVCDNKHNDGDIAIDSLRATDSSINIGHGESRSVTSVTKNNAGSGDTSSGNVQLRQVAAQVEALAGRLAGSNTALSEDLQGVALTIKRALRVEGSQRVEQLTRAEEELENLFKQNLGQHELQGLLLALNSVM